jgi:3-phenylpropionate/trans-cinnamate dioxygenase ferredoxin subunit
VVDGHSEAAIGNWHKIADPGEIEDGMIFAIEIAGEEICIGRLCGRLFALENMCSHEEFPLNDGDLLDTCELRCRYHGARFNPFTGEALSLPALSGVKPFKIEEREDGVYLLVD